MTDSGGTKKMVWFAAGVALGAGAAMLLAPASGENTRRSLSQKTGEGGAALASSGRDILYRSKEFFERGRQFAEEAAEMFERGRQLMDTTAAHLYQE